MNKSEVDKPEWEMVFVLSETNIHLQKRVQVLHVPSTEKTKRSFEIHKLGGICVL